MGTRRSPANRISNEARSRYSHEGDKIEPTRSQSPYADRLPFVLVLIIPLTLTTGR